MTFYCPLFQLLCLRLSNNHRKANSVPKQQAYQCSAPQAHQCKITQLTGMTPQATRAVLAGDSTTSRTFREKKQQQSRASFFEFIFVRPHSPG